MDFDQFKASARECADLAQEFEGQGIGGAGLVYAGGFWIMRLPHGSFRTIIGRGEYDAPRATLEPILYHAALACGLEGKPLDPAMLSGEVRELIEAEI